MVYKAKVRERIAGYRAEDELLTTRMIDAGIAALTSGRSENQESLVSAIYAAMRDARPKYSATDAARFWQKVQKAGPDDCWIWTGAKKTRHRLAPTKSLQYGKMLYRGRHVSAHVIAYELANGGVPSGLLVCHSCDNPPCCNPAHLWAGTHVENIKDAWKKGLIPRPGSPGSKNHRAKLNEREVMLIRKRRATGEKLASIGRSYGITDQAVSMICRRVNWKHT